MSSSSGGARKQPQKIGNGDGDSESTAINGAFDVPSAADIVQSVVASLGQSGRIGVERLRPAWAKGYLDWIAVEPGESVIDLLDRIKDEFGGGTYTLKPMGDNGNWVSGARQIQIHGEPKRFKYDDAVRPGQTPVVGQPVVVTAPAASPEMGNVITQVMGLLSSAATGRVEDAKHHNEQILGLLTGLPQNQPAPPQQTDTFKDMDKLLGTIVKLRELSGTMEQPETTPNNMGMGDMDLEKMMMMMMMQQFMPKGMQQQSTQQPMQQQSMQQQPMAGYVQQPIQQNLPQQPPQSPSPFQSTPPQAAPGPAPVNENDYEPISAEEVAEHLNGMNPTDQQGFIAEVMQYVHAPPATPATPGANLTPVDGTGTASNE